MRRREFITGLGGAAAWPLASSAQQTAMPVIGFLSGWAANDSVDILAFFRRGLAEYGYIEGKNVAIEFRFADGHFDRLPAMLGDLIQRRVAVIVVANTTAAALAAKAATKSIPVVFAIGSEPVEIGLVESLNRPGGNLTGITLLQTAVITKRLQMLHELLPAATRIAFLVNPANAALAQADTKEAEAAARILGLKLLILNASSPDEIDTAFATLVREQVGGLLLSSESYFMLRRVQLAVLMARHGVAAVSANRESTVAGGLMSYGADLLDTNHLLGIYIGRILRGEKPSDLPVQQVTKLSLVINTRTAKALGLDVPASLLGRADEVIE